MKKTYLAFALAATTFVACDSGTSSGTADSTTSATDSGNSLNTMTTTDTTATSSASAGPVSDMDKQFMMEAGAGGNTEVMASKVAVERATNPRVKAFANMMISDHTKTNDELKSLASQKSVTLPDSVMEKQHKELDDLRKESAKNFDKAYMKMMDKDHKETIDKFQMASEKCDNTDIRAFASKTIPALKMHKDSVDAIQKAL